MGLMSMLFGSKPKVALPLPPLSIDLARFQCGGTVLGSPVGIAEPYSGQFNSEGAARFDASGIELGVEDGVLDYAFITVSKFNGTFLKNGLPLAISVQTSSEQIIAEFRQPYWTDMDEDEIILFYEYEGGRIEVQFEFPGKEGLGYVLLARNGVMSDPANRKAYRVTKDWPPKQ